MKLLAPCLVPCLATLLLLGGCGTRAPAPAATAESPAHAACREEARQSPALAEESRRVVIGLPTSEERFRQARAEAESRAFTDCLRRRGLARGGGVEPLRQPGF
ncbi:MULTISPECIES: phosphoribosylamine--glycine ligase [Roseomonadaceae]|uniref:Phosphoribosylamine--glycine ligase n=1 Tax=Falsiroseomonas oleicola TaxID=2801474 RepID=A0ABS6HEE1_9PROT|nr:phosphoribosylamine--glycine ligase [Roseomonas oleicola]MBU8546177.1 phosphoribosylamine--glycine ligase [Roseomonas oleicola]